MRMSYINDGINKVVKTHGMSLKSSIDWACENAGIEIEKYYEYLGVMYERHN